MTTNLRMLDFSVRLPGFTLHAMKYVDPKNHELRYTLKDTSTGQVYLSLVFSVVLPEIEDKQETSNGSKEGNDELGKFDWEPEPAAGDVE